MTAAADYNWLEPLSDDEKAKIVFSEPTELLADDDWYFDATSPKRGPVQSMDGEFVPKGGIYIRRSKNEAVWDRLELANRGKL